MPGQVIGRRATYTGPEYNVLRTWEITIGRIHRDDPTGGRHLTFTTDKKLEAAGGLRAGNWVEFEHDGWTFWVLAVHLACFGHVAVWPSRSFLRIAPTGGIAFAEALIRGEGCTPSEHSWDDSDVGGYVYARSTERAEDTSEPACAVVLGAEAFGMVGVASETRNGLGLEPGQKRSEGRRRGRRPTSGRR